MVCRPDRDRGAVAVLVAVLVAFVLLPVGALAVDLGAAWAQRVSVQGIAEQAALAGARYLPDGAVTLTSSEQAAAEAQAVAEAVRSLCQTGTRAPDWASLCPSTGVPAWAADGSDENGEVSVEDSAVDYPAGAVSPAPVPRVLRVVTPPVTVEFGLAKVAGFDDVREQRVAAARRGLPYPVDHPLKAAPFYLTTQDIDDPTSTLCLRVTQRPTNSVLTEPTADPGFALGDWPRDPSSGDVVGDTDGNGNPDLPDQGPHPLRVEGAEFGAVPPVLPVAAALVTVYVGLRDAAHAATVTTVEDPDLDGRYDLELTTPDLSGSPLYGPDVPIWFVYDDLSSDGKTSTHLDVDFPALPGVPPMDCDPVDEGRGLVDLPRADGSRGAGAATVADVRAGLDTTLRGWTAWPGPQESPGADVDCYAPGVVGAAVPATAPDPPLVPGAFVPEANCVPIKSGVDVSQGDLTTALLGPKTGSDGRLRPAPDCSPDTGSITGWAGTFDRTRLFAPSNALVRPAVSTSELRTRLIAGRPADADFRDAITAKVFNCPRLLLVPVVDAARPIAADGHLAVVGLTYFWVSDTTSWGRPSALRGTITMGTGGQTEVVGLRGWVVDPGYLAGGDWVDHPQADPDDALPMSVPRAAVLVRAPGSDHPENAP